MTCDDYLQDPEANAAHLETCEACSALTFELDRELDGEIDVQPRPIHVDALPLAPWEGASHRTWPLVIVGLSAAFILAVVLFYAAGVSSLSGITTAMMTSVPPVKPVVRVLQLTGHAIGLPIVAVLFVAINSILFLLLRRAPRGIDV
jgi:anti-sigma factor RsiW